jgi:dihydroflavonol-4-reductase
VRVVVTGGAGFIGRAIVAHLAQLRHDVAALVRDANKARHLAQDGVTLVPSDLSEGHESELLRTMEGADGVIHAAGAYRVGIRAAERQQMWESNVGTTQRVLDAAIAAGVPRTVYVSTNNVFGDTGGEIVDETFQRDLGGGFLSWYDETKFRAHEAAIERIARGAPVVIVQPGQTYGPHDHSDASAQLELAHAGRLRYMVFGALGLAWVHVDDLAGVIVAALDRGRLGEAYSLAGDCRRQGEAVAIAARIGGHRPPRLSVPTGLIRMMAPINDLIGGLPGMPPNLAETLRAGGSVTYWASHEKATRDLGFEPRSLEQGVADTWGRA